MNGRLIGLQTDDPLFVTDSGVKVGTPLPQALAKTPNAQWSGYEVQCVGIQLPAPKATTFDAAVYFTGGSLTPMHPHVANFFLTSAPTSFGDGC